MKNSYLLTGLLLGVAASAGAQSTSEGWTVVGGVNGASTGNGWIDSGSAGRGIDFVSATAAKNPFGQAAAVVPATTAATMDVHYLAASTGQNLGKITFDASGDGTISHYRIAASVDGYVFSNGFSGTVQMHDGTTTTKVILPADYGFTGNSRAMDVAGDVAAGTAKIFCSRGNTVGVFANSSAATGTFTLIGSIASGFASDVQALAVSPDGAKIVLSNAGGNLKIADLTYGPFSASTLEENPIYSAFWKTGVDIDGAGKLALGESGGTEDGFALAIDVTNTTATHVPVTPSTLDDDGDAVYDAGTVELNAASTVVDVALDPATGDVYGLSAASPSASPVAPGAVIKLTYTAPSSVREWSLY